MLQTLVLVISLENQELLAHAGLGDGYSLEVAS